jgi:hypothetical protein
MRNQKFVATLVFSGFVLACAFWRFNISLVATAQDLKVKQDDLMIGCSVVDALDDCIQDRFRKTNSGFGFARVSTPQTEMHARSFFPRSADEAAAVAELEQAGWQTVFYLAGRRLLNPKPDASDWEAEDPAAPRLIVDPGKLLIGGPVIITRKNRKDAPPKPIELWDQGHKAILAFSENARRNTYDFSVGNWQVEARPVRAGESCLKCHQGDVASPVGKKQDEAEAKPNPLRVGDPLGVVMYAYTRKN